MKKGKIQMLKREKFHFLHMNTLSNGSLPATTKRIKERKRHKKREENMRGMRKKNI